MQAHDSSSNSRRVRTGQRSWHVHACGQGLAAQCLHGRPPHTHTHAHPPTHTHLVHLPHVDGEAVAVGGACVGLFVVVSRMRACAGVQAVARAWTSDRWTVRQAADCGASAGVCVHVCLGWSVRAGCCTARRHPWDGRGCSRQWSPPPQKKPRALKKNCQSFVIAALGQVTPVSSAADSAVRWL